MPQMSPMMWLIMFMLFMFIMFIMMSIIYTIFMNKMIIMKKNYMKKKMIWKW
uniref:ATP synthase F0 subunit 8 n=1 Tax=Stenopirates sp. NKU01 TaxID=1124183 RepID=A0A1D6UZC9_9HEMI|nr:ATP synthase F0 subunit 8 [Stenopirates sp. NKU01]